MLLSLSPKTMAMVREETNNRVLKEDANFMLMMLMNDISRDGCAADDD